jgi:thiosulfate/3-mercaptopyruvate sulfurtransferase
MYTLLISADELRHLHERAHERGHETASPLVIFDCSFDLMRPDAADGLFAEQHIAGAQQAHLERDLSTHDPAQAVNGGRHPLPRRELLARWLGRMGVNKHTQVVVYDRQGCHYCGRLWWMLKWLGHEAVAVLDGGLQAWQAAGGPIETGPARPATAQSFELREPLRTLVSTDQVAQRLGQGSQTVVDARAAARYRGDVEPLDPVAGHIPQALNRPFTDNFTADGRFKSGEQLRSEWQSVLGAADVATVVHHCGSGVTAVPNLLAMELAGYGPTALYAGSWSEWCRTPGLPCTKG